MTKKNTKNQNIINDLRIKIIKIINDLVIYNLNLNLVINSISEQFNDGK